MVESLFSWMFKYRPAVFEKADFAFGAPGSVILLLAAGAAVGLPALITYSRVRGRSTRRDRLVLAALRGAAITLVLVCLFRPMLLLSASVPQRNYVGVLLDDSRSMQIADVAGRPRSDFVRHAFGSADSALLKALDDRFVVRLFSFASTASRIDSAGALRYAAGETHLGESIERARQELEAVPLSGLVVVSDGADNSHAAIGDELLSLRSRSVPIFTVGVGRSHFDADVEIPRVAMPHSALLGSTVVADVFVRQRGLGGRHVPLLVEDNGHVVARADVTLGADDDVQPVRVSIGMLAPGLRTLTFRIPVQPGELVTQNNARRAAVFVRPGRQKILYVEGQPRFEMRFIREAVADDSSLQLSVLQRTAENKFLRLDVDGPTDLAAGFPATREALFRYRAVVLGSVEASFFSRDQLRMLADFVGTRGGGLLFLGGRSAFAEGGYAGTPLADVMPVVVQGDAVPDSLTFFADLAVHETPAGEGHPVTQIDTTVAASARRWETLPPVTSVNLIRQLKPGAVTLISGAVLAGGRSGLPGVPMPRYEQPVLAYQRYGRGLAVALPIQDSWQWRMGADVPVEDKSFQIFWRQLLRWLASDAPTPVTARIAEEAVRPRGTVHLVADVRDSAYGGLDDAKVVAHVTGPVGYDVTLPMDWAVDRDGEYRAAVTAPDSGSYEVRVEAKAASGSTVIGADSAFITAAPPQDEYFDAEMRASLLQRIADETGGRFYTPETVKTLPEDLTMTKRGVTSVNQMDLWDMPAMFLLLVGLLSAEWGYRKWRGLV